MCVSALCYNCQLRAGFKTGHETDHKMKVKSIVCMACYCYRIPVEPVDIAFVQLPNLNNLIQTEIYTKYRMYYSRCFKCTFHTFCYE